MIWEIMVKKDKYLYNNPSTDHVYIYGILEDAGSYTDEGEEFTFDVLFKKDFIADLKCVYSLKHTVIKILTLRVSEKAFEKIAESPEMGSLPLQKFDLVIGFAYLSHM